MLREFLVVLLALFATAMFALSIVFVVFAAVDHNIQQVGGRVMGPEFGTTPPDCSGLEGVRWQECMGVGPK